MKFINRIFISIIFNFFVINIKIGKNLCSQKCSQIKRLSISVRNNTFTIKIQNQVFEEYLCYFTWFISTNSIDYTVWVLNGLNELHGSCFFTPHFLMLFYILLVLISSTGEYLMLFLNFGSCFPFALFSCSHF